MIAPRGRPGECSAQKGRQLSLPERIDPRHTCVVVIDMQNDFCHADGLFGKLGHDLSCMKALKQPMGALLAAAREKNVPIIFVRAIYDDVFVAENLAEIYGTRSFGNDLCQEGSWGADWFDEIRPSNSSNEIVVTKHRFSAFWGTSLDLYLRSNAIETVVFVGVVTSGCVESSARDAFFNDYRIVVVSDCVAEASQERHDASLRKIAQTFGAVQTSNAIVDAWHALPERVDGWQKTVGSSDLNALVDCGQTALLLIDFQNDFCEPSGQFGQQGEDIGAVTAAVTNTKRLLQAARDAGVLVIHIRAEYGEASASSVSMRSNSTASASGCCRPNTPGAEFVEALQPLPNELVVLKHRFSAFIDTRLELILRTNKIRNVIATGVATHCCVESTVRDACMKDFFVIIPSDCVASRGSMKHLHDNSLETMGLYFGTVAHSQNILAAWNAQSHAGHGGHPTAIDRNAVERGKSCGARST
jgi:nicotinamidase-related amidase